MCPDATQPQESAVTAAPAGDAPKAPAPSGAKKPEMGRRRAPFPVRRKACRFCAEKVRDIDYKQIQILRTFLTESGKILSARVTGSCARHQRQLSRSIKR